MCSGYTPQQPAEGIVLSLLKLLECSGIGLDGHLSLDPTSVNKSVCQPLIRSCSVYVD